MKIGEGSNGRTCASCLIPNANMTNSRENNRFYVRRRTEVVLSLIGALGFGCFAAFGVSMPWFAPSDRIVHARWFGWSLAVCLLIAAAFCIHEAVVGLRGWLRTNDDEVCARGAWTTTTLKLRDVSSLRWRIAFGPAIVVLGSTGRLVISLRDRSRPDQLELIRHFRRALPVDLQSNWVEFCGAHAFPLRRDVECDALGPGEFMQTRRRLDWFFLVLGVAVCIVSVALTWYGAMYLPFDLNPFRKGQGFVGLGFVGLLWLLLRLLVPADGVPIRRQPMAPSPNQEMLTMAGSILLFGGLWILVFALAEEFRDTAIAVAVGAFLSVAGFGIMIYSRRNEKVRKLQACKKCAVDWESREALGAPAPD